MADIDKPNPLDEQSITILAVARAFDHEGRLAGQKNGPLGRVGHEILETILQHGVDPPRSGAVYALNDLAEAIRRSRNAVTRALSRLENHGFVTRRQLPPEADLRRVTYELTAMLPEALAGLVDRPDVQRELEHMCS